jgi:hypothetical protein
MTDLPALPLNPEQEEYLIEKLAFQDTNLTEIQEEYEKFFKTSLNGEVLWRLRKEKANLIKEKRESLYSLTDTIPCANSFPRLALAQSRLEDLAKNPKVVRTVRKGSISEKQEYWEEVKEIDDDRLHKWATFAQNEEYLAKKLLVELIVKEVDKKKIPLTGFKPIRVSSGLEEED